MAVGICWDRHDGWVVEQIHCFELGKVADASEPNVVVVERFGRQQIETAGHNAETAVGTIFRWNIRWLC